MKREEAEQIALIEWAKLYHNIYPYLFYLKQEGKCSIWEGAKAKRMGKKSGVSDLFLAVPKNDKHGMWIELKAPKTLSNVAGKLAPSQRSFLDLMKKQNYEAVVVWGWVEAAINIFRYLEMDSIILSKLKA